MNDTNVQNPDASPAPTLDAAPDLEVLDGVLAKAADLLDGVRVDQKALPTPCPEYDVGALMDHMVGWVQVFGAGSNEKEFPEDPSSYRCGEDPAAEFRLAAGDVVEGWRTHGLDRTVRVSSGESPGEMVFNMTLMEYLTHGWDLAVATGQRIPFTEAEAEATLRRAETTLPPEYRGGDMPFADEVPVPTDAPALDRVIGFMGRDPRG